MGGGVQDHFGYLAPWASEGGYSATCALRNQYFKMHMPFIEVFVKLGIIGFSYYFYVLVKIMKNKSIINFMTFIVLLLIFYVSKENILLTLILIISGKYYNSIKG